MGLLSGHRRRRRARELERRLQELDRWDAEYGLGAWAGPPPRRRRSSLLPAMIVVLVFAVAAVMHPALGPAGLREVVGSAAQRAGPSAEDTEGEGSYAFLATQPGGSDPVGYNPCSTIEIVVNPAGAWEGHAQLVETAAANVSEASGLSLQVVGTTEDRDYQQRGPNDPVLVMWADEQEVPELAGEVAGIGGSTAYERMGFRQYVSGMVVLDAAADPRLGARGRQAVMDHEFGHLVGLDHVDDPRELMHERGGRALSFGPGDRAGLQQLGSLPCRG